MNRLVVKRLHMDYLEILDHPIEDVLAHPVDDNILEWHFAIIGPNDTFFENGIYHGELIFPEEYPMKPPAIYFITPNGLFECNTDLCHSVHESWLAGYRVSTILNGLWFAFYSPTADNLLPFTNTSKMSNRERFLLAKKSLAFNLMDKTFCKYFPQLMKVNKEEESDENANIIYPMCEPPKLIAQTMNND